MCGFVVTAFQEGGESHAGQLIGTLAHRGPDAESLVSLGLATIGFRRLAIRAVEDGEQPFVDEQTKNAAVVNGEIYNSDALRIQLQRLGQRFSTESDCEVLFRGYLQWGGKIFSLLRGMFSAVIYDVHSEELILARDPLGKKPLYWSQETSGAVVVASEPCAFPEHGAYDWMAISHFFSLDGLHHRQSFRANIRQVHPGEVLRLSRYGSVSETFWEPPEPLGPQKKRLSIQKFSELLRQSVERRILSEQPLGVFLSAGVDSSLIGVLAAQHVVPGSVTAFILDIGGKNYSEARFAAKNADVLGFNHHVIKLDLEELAEIASDLPRLICEPINDPGLLGELALSRAARDFGVRVALTGDGGDELFHGYPHLKAHRLMLNPILAAGLRSEWFLRALEGFPDRAGYFSTGFVAQRFARGAAEEDFLDREFAWRGGFREELVEELLGSRYRDSRGDVKERIVSTSRGRQARGLWSWANLRGYLESVMLPKIDRATMAYGVEARSPFLDIDVVDYVLSSQNSNGTRLGVTKNDLRRILKEASPKITLSRRKHGMGIPVRELLLGPLNVEWRDLTDHSRIVDQGLLDVAVVESVVKRLEDGRVDTRKEAWALFVFQKWLGAVPHC